VRLARAFAFACAGVGLLATAAHASEPAAARHALTWYVHEDLLTVERPLSFWEGLLELATADANALLQGANGPDDVPCCVEFAVASVSSFADTDPSRSLLELDSELEFNDIKSIGSGERAFLVDSLNYCGGPSNAIGCATRPACSVYPDPGRSIIMVVTVEAWETHDRLGTTLAHERGHNACLEHITGSDCQLMQDSSGGACLQAAAPDQCSALRYAYTGSSTGTCGCHASLGIAEADASACTTESSEVGLCSGGLCGETGSDASVTLVVSAGTEASTGEVTDEWLAMSGVTGGWSISSEYGSGLEVRGFAWSPGRETLYGIAPERDDERITNGAWTTTNSLVELDPTTGDVTIVGSIEGFDEMVALAFDPGATAADSDDRLLALALDWNNASVYCRELVEIDPDDASASAAGSILGSCSDDLEEGGMQGLAYDSVRDKLFATVRSSTSQLRQINLPCSGTCNISNVATDSNLYRNSPSLAYFEDTDRFYLLGFRTFVGGGDPAINFDTLDGGTFFKSATITIQGFTSSGLAALPNPLPVPEPSVGLLGGAALLALSGLRRRPAPASCHTRAARHSGGRRWGTEKGRG